MFYHYGRVASEKGVNYAKNSDSRYQRILTEIHSQTGQSYSNFKSLFAGKGMYEYWVSTSKILEFLKNGNVDFNCRVS